MTSVAAHQTDSPFKVSHGLSVTCERLYSLSCCLNCVILILWSIFVMQETSRSHIRKYTAPSLYVLLTGSLWRRGFVACVSWFTVVHVFIFFVLTSKSIRRKSTFNLLGINVLPELWNCVFIRVLNCNNKSVTWVCETCVCLTDSTVLDKNLVCFSCSQDFYLQFKGASEASQW